MVLVVLLLRRGFIDAFIVVLMFLVALHEWLLIVKEVHFHKYIVPRHHLRLGLLLLLLWRMLLLLPYSILSSPIIMKLIILIPTVGE